VSTSEIQGGLVGYVLCKGHYYVSNGKTRPNGDNIFADSGTAAPSPPGATASHAHKAWGDLQSAVNRDLPTATARIAKLNATTLRRIPRRRRVRG